MGFLFSKNEAASSESANDKDHAIQVNPWDSSAVKNAIDDAAKQIALDKLKFEEVFKLMNTRLFISSVAVSISLFALGYDYVNPFPKSKSVLAICSISYFAMMGVFTLFTVLREKNIVYEGEDMETVVGAPAKLQFSTSLKKYQNIFQFSINLQNGTHKGEAQFEFPIEKFFTEDGALLKDKFETLLCSNFEKLAHIRKGESKKTN